MEILLLMFGGFWGVKEKIIQKRHGFFRKFYLTIYYLYQRKNGFYIAHSAQFAGKSCFPHGFKGVFIAGGARIGSNCVIFHHVTIGGNSLADSPGVGSPVIGNNVYIGAGATIVGKITIGDNCRIGANCTVFKDVGANCVVVTAEPKIIQRDTQLNNKFYKWSPDGPVYFSDGRWYTERDQTIISKLKDNL